MAEKLAQIRIFVQVFASFALINIKYCVRIQVIPNNIDTFATMFFNGN